MENNDNNNLQGTLIGSIEIRTEPFSFIFREKAPTDGVDGTTASVSGTCCPIDSDTDAPD